MYARDLFNLCRTHCNGCKLVQKQQIKLKRRCGVSFSMICIVVTFAIVGFAIFVWANNIDR